MIYKDFIAEASAKIMAACIFDLDPCETEVKSEQLKKLAHNSVTAAMALADELEADFQNVKPDGGNKRFSEKDTFFDNYVNWTKNM